MKRPLISELERWMMIHAPETFTAKRLELALAGAKLKREIARTLSKICKQ